MTSNRPSHTPPHHDILTQQEPFKPEQAWFWTEEWQAMERGAEADLAAGRCDTFDTMEEFLTSLE
jgi:hypothetical protein